MSAHIIEIPLRKQRNEMLELNLRDFPPDVGVVLDILVNEKPKLSTWIRIAKFCYESNRVEDFLRVLEEAIKQEAQIRLDANPYEHQHSLDDIYVMLAAYHTQVGGAATEIAVRNAAFRSAAEYFSLIPRKTLEDEQAALANGFYLLWKGETDKAKRYFNILREKNAAEVLTNIGLASVHQREGNYREALRAYQAVLVSNPECPVAIRVGIGICLSRLDCADNAQTAFQRAHELDPRSAAALVGMAVLELGSKQKDTVRQGTKHLSDAYGCDNKHPVVLNHLANHFFINKDYERARYFAQHALQHSGNTPEIMAESHFHLARTYHVAKDYDQALQHYLRSTENAKDFPLAHYGLGQMYLHRGDRAKALESFEIVYKADPSNYETQKVLGSLLAQGEAGDAARAEKLLREVTKARKDDVEAWLELAALLERSAAEPALQAYQVASDLLKEIGDIPVEIVNNMGCLQLKLGRHDAALASFTKCLEHCRRSLDSGLSETDRDYYKSIIVSITYNCARARELTRDTETAVHMYERLSETHKTYTHSLLRLGAINQDRKLFREAADWYTQAAALAPHDPTSWALLGDLHLSRHEWQQAQGKFEKILDDKEGPHKDDPYAVLSLANVYLFAIPDDPVKKDRFFGRAEKLCASVLAKDRQNAYAANGLGCVLAYKGEFLKAKEVFMKVLEALSSDESTIVDSWLNLAHCYVELGQHENAIKLYQNCLSRAADYRILTYLARAYVRNGQPRQALAMLLRALHSNPTDHGTRYNIAVTLMHIAVTELERQEHSAADLVAARVMLSDAQRYFSQLAHLPPGKPEGPPAYSVKAAQSEAKRCGDFLKQSEHALQQAQQKEAAIQERIAEQKRLRAEFEHKLKAEKEAKAAAERQRLEEMQARADEYRRQMEEHGVFKLEERVKEERRPGEGRRKRKTDDDDMIDDSDLVRDSPEPEAGPADDGDAASDTESGRGRAGSSARSRAPPAAAAAAAADAEDEDVGASSQQDKPVKRKRHIKRNDSDDEDEGAAEDLAVFKGD